MSTEGRAVSVSDIAAMVDGRDVTVLAHVRPDADALGSAVALALALRKRGVSARVSFGDEPFHVPRQVQCLPGLELVVHHQDAGKDLVISVDTSSESRLGVLQHLIDDAADFVNIDHHMSNTGFGLHWVDPSAPAAAVMVAALIDELGVEFDRDIASAIYAGVVTDTGGFRYAATKPETLELAARLMRLGVDHEGMCRALFDDEPWRNLHIAASAVSKAVLEPDVHDGLGLVWTAVLASDRNHISMDAAERVIGDLRVVNEAEVAAVFKQRDDGLWSVSLRSKGKVDVGAAAVALGGGGHTYAAGYEVDDVTATPEVLVSQLKRALSSSTA